MYKHAKKPWNAVTMHFSPLHTGCSEKNIIQCQMPHQILVGGLVKAIRKGRQLTRQHLWDLPALYPNTTLDWRSWGPAGRPWLFMCLDSALSSEEITAPCCHIEEKEKETNREVQNRVYLWHWTKTVEVHYSSTGRRNIISLIIMSPGRSYWVLFYT